MKTIVIKNQKELDALPLKFEEYSIIEIRSKEAIVVNKKYDNATVEAWGSSTVEAWGSSRVVARESSRVVAWESSRVEARESSTVDCFQSAFVMIFSSAVVIKKLLDYSTAHFKNINPIVEEKSETATIKFEPKYEISFNEWIRRGYVSADGIIKKLLSQKKIGEIEVFEVEEFIDIKSSYLVKRGDTFSHGETIEKAIEDLRYKISDRDTSKYNHWKTDKDKKIRVDEAIVGYRTITGACEFGTKQFVESLSSLSGEISINEIIQITNGKFGNDTLKEFLK